MKGSEVVGHSCSIYGVIPEIDVSKDILLSLLKRTYAEFTSDVNFPSMTVIDINSQQNSYRLPSYVSEVYEVKIQDSERYFPVRMVNFSQFYDTEPYGEYICSITTDEQSKVLLVKPVENGLKAVVFFRPNDIVSLDDDIPLPERFHFAIVDGMTKNLGYYLISKGYDPARIMKIIEIHTFLFERHKTDYRRYLSRDTVAYSKPYDLY